MPRINIDRAGRVVIPKYLRTELHLRAGDALEVDSSGAKITLQPVREEEVSMRKEQGIWVFRAGRPLNPENVNLLLERGREQRSDAVLEP